MYVGPVKVCFLNIRYISRERDICDADDLHIAIVMFISNLTFHHDL